ncbi:MAG: hypothetical protein KDC92_07270, partial [Bacteroidetes bacterium]|nr:hypothetical protein [Bacteroidota bacterium]
PFTDTRYLNALIDYEVKTQYGSYYNRAYVLPGNKLDVYNGSYNGGIIDLREYTVLDMVAEFKDRTGNTCQLSFILKGVKEFNYPSQVLKGGGEAIFKHNQTNKFETDEIRLEFPEGCFYDDFAFRYDYSVQSSYKYSLKHSVHSAETPVHKYYKVSIKAKNIPEKYQNKAVVTRNGRSEGGYYSNGWVLARARYFGSFGVSIDTIAPSIIPHKIDGYNLKWRKSISIGIGDNLSGLKSYKTFIDGEFVIMEHDYKAGVLRYSFSTEPDDKVHVMKIIAVDRVGNKNETELKYTR